MDEMEVWEAAAILGVNHPEQAVAGPTGHRDLVAERIAASKGLAPPPQPGRPAPVDPRVIDMVRRRKAAG